MKLLYTRDIKTGERNWCFWCPACNFIHRYRVNRGSLPEKKENGEPLAVWKFNGSLEKPSFTPSLLYYATDGKWEDKKWVEGKNRKTLCHMFLTDGVIRYCGDNPHSFNNKSIPLPDLPERYQ